MQTQSKDKAVTMAREINEALITLEVALSPGAGESECIEAKNIVAQVIRNYRSFIAELPAEDQEEAKNVLGKKIEAMVLKAKKLPA